ncbi:MAG: high-affinity nickel-transport family protein [Gemmatimonadales bacterium]
MFSALSAGILGFLLGLRHATDADHVVAVTTIVTRERTFGRAAWIGGLWGIGHSFTVFVVGGALVVFRVVIPPRLGLGLEFGVALMLILLGFNNLRSTATTDATAHGHEHPPRFSGWRPVLIGIVHGLAGSAAVAILVLAAIPETGWALAYLAVFGLGTIIGMMLITWLIAAPSVYAARRVVHFQRGIRLAAGALSLVFGLLLAHSIITQGGLFSASPSWSPR